MKVDKEYPIKECSVIDNYNKLVDLFIEAVAHLEYCGYGDEYERSGAKESGLIDRINKMCEGIKNEDKK